MARVPCSRGRRVAILLAAACLALASVAVVLGGATPRASGAVAAGQDHDCIVGKPPPNIDWSALTNPVLSYPNIGVKDQALQWSGGAWHMLFSDMTQTSAAPHVKFDVAIAQSPDLRHWSAPTVIATNAASPDIVRDPAGDFVVTYQTPDGLDYRVSTGRLLAELVLASPSRPWTWPTA